MTIDLQIERTKIKNYLKAHQSVNEKKSVHASKMCFPVFAFLGNRFGGNGRTTFALPKLSGLKTASGETIDCFIAIEGRFPLHT